MLHRFDKFRVSLRIQIDSAVASINILGGDNHSARDIHCDVASVPSFSADG